MDAEGRGIGRRRKFRLFPGARRHQGLGVARGRVPLGLCIRCPHARPGVEQTWVLASLGHGPSPSWGLRMGLWSPEAGASPPRPWPAAPGLTACHFCNPGDVPQGVSPPSVAGSFVHDLRRPHTAARPWPPAGGRLPREGPSEWPSGRTVPVHMRGPPAPGLRREPPWPCSLRGACRPFPGAWQSQRETERGPGTGLVTSRVPPAGTCLCSPGAPLPPASWPSRCLWCFSLEGDVPPPAPPPRAFKNPSSWRCFQRRR